LTKRCSGTQTSAAKPVYEASCATIRHSRSPP
jgi:hypothetical protein